MPFLGRLPPNNLFRFGEWVLEEQALVMYTITAWPSFLDSVLFFLPKKNDTLSNKTVPKESFNPRTACLEGNTHKNISNFNPGVNAHLQGSLGCRDPAINCTRRGFHTKYTPEKNVQLSTPFAHQHQKSLKKKIILN